MSAAKWKRWVAGICASAMIAGAPAMGAYATVSPSSRDLDLSTPSGRTDIRVKVEETAPVNPTYVITIPAKVDFGTIQQPRAEGTSYVTKPITVECSELTDLADGEKITVFVKDSTAATGSDPFQVRNIQTGMTLTYKMHDAENDMDIQDTTWYTNGFLFASFTEANQQKTMNLKLDRGQLYGKELFLYGGDYAGSLIFYTMVSTNNV